MTSWHVERLSVLLALCVGGVHRSPIDSPHRGSVMGEVRWFRSCLSWWSEQTDELSVIWDTGLSHAKLVSLTSPSCSGWPVPMNTQGQQRTAEQRWVRWLQCLIRKWSCVNHQFQFHTQIAYKPTYITHDLCYLLLFNYWHWHKI